MNKPTALSSAKTNGQRGLLSRVFLRPLTLGMILAFIAGVAVVGWARQEQLAEREMPAHARVYPISVPPMPLSTRTVSLEPEVFDYRGFGRGFAGSPRPLPAVEVAQAVAPVVEPEVPSEQVAAVLHDIAPAAGPVIAAATVMPPVAPSPSGKPRIAIVIDDMGPNYRDSLAALELPKEITLSFLPYAEQLGTLVSRARASGHELLVHLPMEPMDMNGNNPGPGALMVSQKPEEISRAVVAALDSFNGHVGINNHMGSRFSADTSAMRLVLRELAARDLLFFDSRTTPQSVGIEVAASLNMKFVGRDVFLDNEIDFELISAQLNTLERLARVQGQASAIGHPYPQTIAAINAWLPGAKERGIELVPISALAQRLGVSQVSAAAE